MVAIAWLCVVWCGVPNCVRVGGGSLSVVVVVVVRYRSSRLVVFACQQSGLYRRCRPRVAMGLVCVGLATVVVVVVVLVRLVSGSPRSLVVAIMLFERVDCGASTLRVYLRGSAGTRTPFRCSP